MNIKAFKSGSVVAVLAASLAGCVAYYPAEPYAPAPVYGPPAVAYAPAPVYAPPPVVYPYPAYGSINLSIGGRGYGRGYYGGPRYRHWR
jgi:hypothetical protein